MTILDESTAVDELQKPATAPDPEHLSAADPSGPDPAAATPPAAEPDPEVDDGVSPTALALATVTAMLAAGGAAWMVGGLFRGAGARLVSFTGVLLGGLLVYFATRWRSAVLQYLVLPVSLLAGALLVGSAAGAGTSSLPALVKDAATSSQVLQPPVDFAPGWRLILLVVLSLLTAAAASLSLSAGRPRLAVAVPAPLTAVAALVQPSATAISTSAISVAFVMMALATSYAADGSGDAFDVRFELRRLGRSALAGVLLIAALIAASKVSFLFPDRDQHHVVPPRRPPVSPPQPDVPLYTVKGQLNGPLRAGVIDVYDVKAGAWLLPPDDKARLVRLRLPADLPGAPSPLGDPVRVTVTVKQATGRLLPTLAGARRIEGGVRITADPRTQALGLPERPVYTGLRYEVVANPAPNGQQLSRATGTVPDGLKEFLTAPAVPPAVQALLAKAPQAPYARLQSLRTELYRHFTAAGQGRPTDVGADRVVQFLTGGTGNPYELTAAEGLLARWAGIPSRIGFGYYNTQASSGQEVEIRPADAATYLEVYLAPYGWVPVVGTPPRAQQSLSNNQRNNDSSIQAAPELGINVYLPVRVRNGLPLYAYARYYLVRILPVAFGLGALLLLYPVALKRLRRRRRAAWAAGHGSAGEVAVAYCDLRDLLIDLALPGRGMTPLELVQLVAEDESHEELAWLVTRGLWGDLRGTLTDEDAEQAWSLARSLRSRVLKAQPETARLLAAVSRASLRAPYSREVPNVWVALRLPRIQGLVSAIRTALRRRPAPAPAALVLLLALVLGGCGGGARHISEPSVPFPTRLAPSPFAGLQTQDEPKAAEAYLKGAQDRNVIVSEGKVLSFSRGGLVQAALQVAQLKPGYVSSNPEVIHAITASVGHVARLGPERGHVLYVLEDGTQRLYLWFPTQKAMALLVTRSQISAGAAESMARALIDYGDGDQVNEQALSAALSGVGDATPSAGATPLPTPPPAAPPAKTPTPAPTREHRR